MTSIRNIQSYLIPRSEGYRTAHIYIGIWSGIRPGSLFYCQSVLCHPQVPNVALQNLWPIFLLSLITVKTQNSFTDFSSNNKRLQVVSNNLKDPFKLKFSHFVNLCYLCKIYVEQIFPIFFLNQASFLPLQLAFMPAPIFLKYYLLYIPWFRFEKQMINTVFLHSLILKSLTKMPF